MFQTERLRIRRWREADLPALFEVYGDAEAMRWVGDGRPLTREGCERWLAVTEANYAARGYGMFTAEHLADAGIVGFCGLVHPGDQPEAEIKYALRRPYWGQGLATEAARGLLAFGRDSLGLATIIATVAPENAASRRVLTKAGMTLTEPRMDKDGETDEDGEDTLYFEWRA